jgi:hypothetical protein
VNLKTWLPMLALAGASGCTGNFLSGGSSTAPPSDGSPGVCRPVAAPMRALTARQYDAVVADLVGDTTAPATVLQVPASEGLFDNNAIWVGADETLVRFYVKSAEALATAAVAKQATLFPCAHPAASDEDACLTQVLATFGRRAFRRTLTAAEVTTLTGTFHTVRALDGATWDDGLEAVLEVLLGSPQFLYVTEVGTKVDGAALPTSRLTAVEVATRLALLVWGSTPDDALLDAAEGGHLVTADELKTQARRLLSDPRSQRGFLHFASQWLELERADGATKSAELYPSWSATTWSSAQTELTDFLSSTWTGGGHFGDLMTSPQGSVDAELATLYGVTPPTSGRATVPLPAVRAGILTRVGWLASHAHQDETSPTIRGKAVRTHLLCENIAPPPNGVVPKLPTVTGPSTLRDRLAAHVDASSSCSGCHRLMDPIGFGLEGFNAIGVARTTERNGLPIDDTGDLIEASGTTPFKGGVELSQWLSQSPQAQRCYLTQVYRYAQGRTDSSKDRCHLDDLFSSLPATATLQDVAVAIVTVRVHRAGSSDGAVPLLSAARMASVR